MNTETIGELLRRKAERESKLTRQVVELKDEIAEFAKTDVFTVVQIAAMMDAATEEQRRKLADLDTFERVLMSLL